MGAKKMSACPCITFCLRELFFPLNPARINIKRSNLPLKQSHVYPIFALILPVYIECLEFAFKKSAEPLLQNPNVGTTEANSK